MEKVSSFIVRKSDSFPNLMMRKQEVFLPISTKPQPNLRVRALLGNCLYRRVVLWTLVGIVLFSITLFNPRLTRSPGHVLDMVQMGKVEPPVGKAPTQLDETVAALIKQSGNDDESAKQSKGDAKAKEESTPKAASEESPKEEKQTKAAKESKKKQNKNQKPKGPHWLDYKQ